MYISVYCDIMIIVKEGALFNMAKVTKIEKITLKKIIENGGATLTTNFNAVTFGGGYQVSVEDYAVIKVRDLRKSFLEYLIKNTYLYVGVWIENGNAYIDISQNFKTKKDAMKIAKENNQISIYDWKNQKVVYCK